MKLEMHRDLNDLAPEQPTIDENIARANRELEEYKKRLDKDYITSNGYWEFLVWKYESLGRPDSMKEKLLAVALEWAEYIFVKGGGIMDMTELAFDALNYVMDETDVDVKLYKFAADKMKKEIPGKKAEPIIGKLMVGLGTELQKPDTE
jgi:hypothetical protein